MALPSAAETSSSMKPYPDQIVTYRMMLVGLTAAVARFMDASTSDDPATTFAPLFEALNWSVALDDRVGEHWAPHGKPLKFDWRMEVPNGELMGGVRYVRNAVWP